MNRKRSIVTMAKGDGQIRLDEQIKNVFEDEQVGDLSDSDERVI